MALPPLSSARASSSQLSVPFNYQAPDMDLKYTLSLKRIPLLGESLTGHLSTWPAYGVGQTILEKRKPCTAPDPKINSNDQPSSIVSKPRFLEQLESYLRRELQCLDLTRGNIQELKLQPHREVFEYFIEDFKTYKPLLSSIKNEYEITLAHQREQIRSLEPLKSMLVSVSEQCEQKIQALREEERHEIKALKKEKLALLRQIDKMKEEKSSLQAQVTKLHKELSKEYLRYRNECDARKLLIADINEMKFQHEDSKLSHSQELAAEDPVMLMLALKMARKDLSQTQVELNTMKANYGDVVPRRDYESHERRYSELLSKMEVLQKDFNQLKEEYDLLLDINKQVLQERDAFCTNLSQMERSSTPRPHWMKCAEVLPGGYDYWITVSEGKTSDELVDVLLAELGWRTLKEKDFFEGMGKGASVPIHLQQEGQIKNLKLSKKDVVNILKEVWKEKTAADQQEKRSSLPEFFLGYLLKRFGSATAAMEWSYCVHETCRMHRTDDYMHLFYNILMGQVDEAVYHGLVALPSVLLGLLVDADTVKQGTVTREQFSQVLRTAFPLKTGDQIEELIDTAETQLRTSEDSIAYKTLFPEDEQWKSGPFMDLLRSQHLAEKQEYLKELRSKLEDVKDVKVDDLRTAFLALDPAINPQTLEGYISQAFRIPREQVEQADSLDLDRVLQQLLAGDIKRTEPPRGT